MVSFVGNMRSLRWRVDTADGERPPYVPTFNSTSKTELSKSNFFKLRVH